MTKSDGLFFCFPKGGRILSIFFVFVAHAHLCASLLRPRICPIYAPLNLFQLLFRGLTPSEDFALFLAFAHELSGTVFKDSRRRKSLVPELAKDFSPRGRGGFTLEKTDLGR